MLETLTFSPMTWEILEERYDIQARFERHRRGVGLTEFYVREIDRVLGVLIAMLA